MKWASKLGSKQFCKTSIDILSAKSTPRIGWIKNEGFPALNLTGING